MGKSEVDKAADRILRGVQKSVLQRMEATSKTSEPKQTIISRSREETALVEKLHDQLSGKHYGSLLRLLQEYGGDIGELVGTAVLTPQMVE